MTSLPPSEPPSTPASGTPEGDPPPPAPPRQESAAPASPRQDDAPPAPSEPGAPPPAATPEANHPPASPRHGAAPPPAAPPSPEPRLTPPPAPPPPPAPHVGPPPATPPPPGPPPPSGPPHPAGPGTAGVPPHLPAEAPRARPRGRRRTVTLVAAALTGCAVLAAAGIAIAVTGRSAPPSGPDPFAGSYPLVTPDPTQSPKGPTWEPTGPPAGPLRTFPGTPTRVVGRVVDRKAGLSYAKLARPYRPIPRFGTHTGGQEFDNDRRDTGYWYCAVYSAPVKAEIAAAAKAAGKANALRAAAELEMQDTIKLFRDAKRTDLAGQPLTVSGRRAWLTAVQITNTAAARTAADPRTYVVIAVDTGRAVPSVAEVHVPNTQRRRLPDINTIVSSLRVVR